MQTRKTIEDSHRPSLSLISRFRVLTVWLCISRRGKDASQAADSTRSWLALSLPASILRRCETVRATTPYLVYTTLCLPKLAIEIVILQSDYVTKVASLIIILDHHKVEKLYDIQIWCLYRNSYSEQLVSITPLMHLII